MFQLPSNNDDCFLSLKIQLQELVPSEIPTLNSTLQPLMMMMSSSSSRSSSSNQSKGLLCIALSIFDTRGHLRSVIIVITKSLMCTKQPINASCVFRNRKYPTFSIKRFSALRKRNPIYLANAVCFATVDF